MLSQRALGSQGACTYRHRYPDEHSVAPHRHGFYHRPALADACVSQGAPEQHGHAYAVRIHQADCGAEQRKVVLDRVGRQVGDDGVGEGGGDEEGEDECGERPEGPVEVRRGREVGGGVRWGEGVERVDTAEEDLYKKRTQKAAFAHWVNVRTHGFGVDVEMVLIVVDTPERRPAGVRDVACSRVRAAVRWDAKRHLAPLP